MTELQALIKRLERANGHGVLIYPDTVPAVLRALTALSRMEAERDALVALINKFALKPIEECKHYEKCYRDAADKMRMMQCIVCNHWQWRGAQGEG